jgi:hypothetical protein
LSLYETLESLPMSPQKSLTAAIPYELMVGYWAGIASVYDDKGVYQDSVQSRVAIYWHIPNKLLHFHQDQEDSVEALLNDPHYNTNDVTAVRNFSQLTVDLEVTGKSCSGEDEHSGTTIVGVETRPDIYLFHLRTKDKTGRYYADYYNNQYFVGPNERHIIGPYVLAAPATRAALQKYSSERKGTDPAGYFPTGTIRFVIAQTFTRISYEIPEHLRTRPHPLNPRLRERVRA